MNITTPGAIDVLIEDSPGKWIKWRTAVGTFNIAASLDFDYSKKGTKIINNSAIKGGISLDSLVLDSKGKIQHNEQEKVNRFINMNFGRIKYYMNLRYQGKK